MRHLLGQAGVAMLVCVANLDLVRLRLSYGAAFGNYTNWVRVFSDAAYRGLVLTDEDRRQEQAAFNDLARAREALMNALPLPKR